MNSLNFLDWQKVKFKHTQGYKPVYGSRDLCFLPGDWLLYPLQKCPCSQLTVSHLDKTALENLFSKRYTKTLEESATLKYLKTWRRQFFICLKALVNTVDSHSGISTPVGGEILMCVNSTQCGLEIPWKCRLQDIQSVWPISSKSEVETRDQIHGEGGEWLKKES